MKVERAQRALAASLIAVICLLSVWTRAKRSLIGRAWLAARRTAFARFISPMSPLCVLALTLEIFLGRYISKEVRGELIDPAPGEPLRRVVRTYEEKGTDVNLGTRLLVDGFEGRFESAAVISNDGDLKMPIQIVRKELGLPVTVVNPVLHSKHRSAALSPDPLPTNASFIRLSAHDVKECQFPGQLISPKGAKLVKPVAW